MIIPYTKKEFLELLKKGDYVVSSTPFGCKEEYSKIVVRRKIGKSVNVIPIPDEYSGCKPDVEIKKLKEKIRKNEKLTNTQHFNKSTTAFRLDSTA